MKASILALLPLLLVVACATSILMRGRCTARKRIVSRRNLILSKIVGRGRGICGPLLGWMMLLGRHWRKSMLGVEHHLLVCPLC